MRDGACKQSDINYGETFTPVVKLAIIRMILNVVLSKP